MGDPGQLDGNKEASEKHPSDKVGEGERQCHAFCLNRRKV